MKQDCWKCPECGTVYVLGREVVRAPVLCPALYHPDGDPCGSVLEPCTRKEAAWDNS